MVYNSQGGNGVAGYGWNISGISVISRIPSTKFHDNTFDAFDRFTFDGQRLMIKAVTTGVYGANGIVYETDSFSNVKITSYGGLNNNPDYFVVEYPDGSKAEYGNAINSKTPTDWGINY